MNCCTVHYFLYNFVGLIGIYESKLHRNKERYLDLHPEVSKNQRKIHDRASEEARTAFPRFTLTRMTPPHLVL